MICAVDLPVVVAALLGLLLQRRPQGWPKKHSPYAVRARPMRCTLSLSLNVPSRKHIHIHIARMATALSQINLRSAHQHHCVLPCVWSVCDAMMVPVNISATFFFVHVWSKLFYIFAHKKRTHWSRFLMSFCPGF